MNRVKKVIASLLLLYNLSPFITAQEVAPQINSTPFTIGIEAGYSCNLISGDGRKGIKNMIIDFETTGKENFIIEGKIIPKFSPQVGAFLDYQFKKNIFFRGGLRFTKRGYNVKIEGEEKDEEYQFDHKFIYEEKFRLTTFEIPFSVSYTLENEMSFSFGFLVGFGRKKSSKMKVTIDEKVFVNGELSEDLSRRNTKEETNLTDSPNNPFNGMFISAEYEIYTNLSLSASFSRIANYAKLDYGKLADTSIALTLKYSLYDF